MFLYDWKLYYFTFSQPFLPNSEEDFDFDNRYVPVPVPEYNLAGGGLAPRQAFSAPSQLAS